MSPRVLAPIGVLALTLVGVALLVVTRPEPTRVEPARAIPTVRTIPGTPRTVRHVVRSQGTVRPRTEADLVAEVEGRILWIAPDFAPGGFFEATDPLIRLDPRDYELAHQRARARLQRASSEQEFANSELKRQEGLSTGGVASASQLADARRAATVAEAAWIEARAALEQAERDLSRTQIRAPFAGRIRDESIDVGQFVNRGQALARIYATDYAEIRLPIPDEELAFIDIPSVEPGRPLDLDGAPVTLSAHFAGQEIRWSGRLVRTEGEIDERSRMVHAVARVEDPYRRDAETPSVPLTVGLFVRAEIQGAEVKDVIVVPRYAMRDDARILVVDAEDRLRSRAVDVIRIDREEVLIQGPLAPGERICVSPVQVVLEGMTVRTLDDTAAAPIREESAR
jgi:RND family efflux transporter MFP subunit